MRSEGHQRVVIDVSAMRSTDSTGMSALLEVRRIFGEQPGAVALLRPSDRLRAALTRRRGRWLPIRASSG